MKNNVFTGVLILLFLVTFKGVAQTELTHEEREKAITYLEKTKSDLYTAVNGLTEKQLNFKATPESWSVAECVEHIAMTENALFGIVDMALQSEPDPSLRKEVKFTDDEVIGLIIDRSSKAQAREEIQPKNTFGSNEASLKAFDESRASNIEFVKTTQEDLRNRYFDFPFGKLDIYQVVLFLSGHTERHTKQIEEVKGNGSFPQ